jgi:hypothetical protein
MDKDSPIWFLLTGFLMNLLLVFNKEELLLLPPENYLVPLLLETLLLNILEIGSMDVKDGKVWLFLLKEMNTEFLQDLFILSPLPVVEMVNMKS